MMSKNKIVMKSATQDSTIVEVKSKVSRFSVILNFFIIPKIDICVFGVLRFVLFH